MAREVGLFEGQLNKYTNVVKGWQYRWFVLDEAAGKLDYYLSKEDKKQKPRGSIDLTGSVVSPTDEDSQSFSISSMDGEFYRLKAADTRQRQQWVDCLRVVTEHQAETQLQPVVRSGSFIGRIDRTPQSSRKFSFSYSPKNTPKVSRKVRDNTPEEFKEARNSLQAIEQKQQELVKLIEDLPFSGKLDPLTSLDKDCLLLKATSQAASHCLRQCYSILEQQRSIACLPASATVEWLEPNNSLNRFSRSVTISSMGSSCDFDMATQYTAVNHDDEITDDEVTEETELVTSEEQKPIILHLLSNLKLGMDLTKVVLPTFILEKRSLLEMYADFLSYPDMFVRIPSLPTPDERMVAVVEYYLCAFHAGKKDCIAKKPYNPLLGETFSCSWDVPIPAGSNGEKVQLVSGAGRRTQDPPCRVTFAAEQVSHHPPVSAFYAECAPKNIYLNSWIWTKSKFMGMSLGVVNEGQGTIALLDHNEQYVYNFPSGYGRSILTIPWMELGGKTQISCAATGYTASVTFHTKPFYGGKLHRISGEIRHEPTNQSLCTFSGEWNGTIQFTYSNGTTKAINTRSLRVKRKKVRPLSMQNEFESRRVWRHVTTALKSGTFESATNYKHALEEQQRNEDKQRREKGIERRNKLFQKEGQGWKYNWFLTKSH